LVQRETAEHKYKELKKSDQHTLLITGATDESVMPSDTECSITVPCK